MKKILPMVFLLSLFIASPLAARTITDLSGRTLELPDKIERIVALRGALSLVCYLNLADRVVGVEHHETTKTSWVGARGRSYRMANPGLGDLPIIGSRNKPQPEKIIGIKPDIILLGSGGERLAGQLERQTGIPVVVVESGDLGGSKPRFYSSLHLIGKLCGVEKRSQEVTDQIETQIAELARRTQELSPAERKRVYIGGLQFKVAHGILGTSRSYPPFEMVKADNVVDKLTVKRKLIRGRFSIKKETFINLDPEVLFICESGLGMVTKELEEPLYQNLTARHSDQIYLLMPHYYGADPATVLSEAWYIGKVLYPERFQDIEIADLADQLYTFFVGRPLYKEMAEIFGGFTKLSELGCSQ